VTALFSIITEGQKVEPGKHPFRCPTMTRAEEHICTHQEQLPAEIPVLDFPNPEPAHRKGVQVRLSRCCPETGIL